MPCIRQSVRITNFLVLGVLAGYAFPYRGTLAASDPPTASASAYDPLAVPKDKPGSYRDFTVQDQVRKREIPVRIYLPDAVAPAPVVLFSHGLGGTRAGCAYLGEHWSARGYVVVFLQHHGSDDSVWRDQPPSERMDAMKKAASLQNFELRVSDVPRVLDQLESWNKEDGHMLHGRLDMSHVGMSGHSFGAVTTQAVSGQSIRLLGPRFTDSRIRAAIAFSPSSPRRGDAAVAFGAVKIPWMLMTGTKDIAPIGDADLASRRAVYPHLPASIDKYELVLHNAEHSAFTERALPGDSEPRNPNHHRVILALSTAFWDAHLRGDAAARAWLQGAGARSVLEAQDQWQFHAQGE
jgi:predicted dienelactone hydrolase